MFCQTKGCFLFFAVIQEAILNMPAKHLVIKGKVQGVFYRASAREVAEKLGLKGWVKNTHEGDVEAFVCGTETALNKFIDWCRRGPSNAVVTAVSVTDEKEKEFENFRILRN